MKSNFTFSNHASKAGHLLFCLFVCLFILPFSLQAQTSKEYTVAQTADFLSDLAGGKYDVFVLSSSGGEYIFTAAVAPMRSLTIKAKSGLAAKPILSYNTATAANSKGFLNPALPDLTLQFEGLELNGINKGLTGDKSQPIFLKSEVAATNLKVVVKDCFIHDFMNVEGNNFNGIFRLEGVGTSFDIQGCIVNNSFGRLILFQTATVAPYTQYGDVVLKNNTFSNILNGTESGGVVFFRSAGSGSQLALGKNLTVDHCTFYNYTSKTDIFTMRSMSGAISITNCIFDKAEVGLTFVNPNTTAPAMIIDYCYLDGFAIPPSGTNTLTKTPAYTNVATLNFGLTNKSDFVGKDAKTAGDTRYYAGTTGISISPEVSFGFNSYPNPVSGQVKFDYHLRRDSQVQLSILNISGQLVTTLIANEYLPAGQYSKSLDVSNYQNGIYFARFTDGGISKSIKILISK